MDKVLQVQLDPQSSQHIHLGGHVLLALHNPTGTNVIINPLIRITAELTLVYPPWYSFQISESLST